MSTRAAGDTLETVTLRARKMTLRARAGRSEAGSATSVEGDADVGAIGLASGPLSQQKRPHSPPGLSGRQEWHWLMARALFGLTRCSEARRGCEGEKGVCGEEDDGGKRPCTRCPVNGSDVCRGGREAEGLRGEAEAHLALVDEGDV